MSDSGYLLNLDKPPGMTSRSAVDHVIGCVGTRRVGHAGTLDPLASGVLVVAVGKATRLLEYIQAQPKRYEAEILLGCTSDTDDAEGTIERHDVAVPPTYDDVALALEGFVGAIEQAPPRFSAIKIAGQRAYRMARAGADFELQPRKVRIDALEPIAYAYPSLRIAIECGGGTYIRSLARDLGARLGTGGMLHQLRRTRVGAFDVREAKAVDALTPANWKDAARGLAAAVAMLPRAALDDAALQRFHAGQTVAYDGADAAGTRVAVFDGAGRLHGVGAVLATSLLRAVKAGFAGVDSSEGPCGGNAPAAMSASDT